MSETLQCWQWHSLWNLLLCNWGCKFCSSALVLQVHILHGEVLIGIFAGCLIDTDCRRSLSAGSHGRRDFRKGVYCIRRQIMSEFHCWLNSLVICINVNFITVLDLLCPLGSPILKAEAQQPRFVSGSNFCTILVTHSHEPSFNWVVRPSLQLCCWVGDVLARMPKM